MPRLAGGEKYRLYDAPHFPHSRRPRIRFSTTAGLSEKYKASCSGRFSQPKRVSSCWAWGIVRGKPSRTNPRLLSLLRSRSVTASVTMSSDTNSPDSMIDSTLLPSSVLSDTACRRSSPLEICGTRYFSAINLAWVPFPQPGTPNSTILIPGSLFYWCFINEFNPKSQ